MQCSCPRISCESTRKPALFKRSSTCASVKEVDRAAVSLQPHLANRSAQSRSPRPSRQKSSLGNPADHLQSRQRVGNVVPESDRNHEIELLVCLPIEHIAEHKLAAIRDSLLFGKLCAQSQHLRSKVDSGNLGAALGQRWPQSAPTRSQYRRSSFPQIRRSPIAASPIRSAGKCLFAATSSPREIGFLLPV
jgi:hypothetical protein